MNSEDKAEPEFFVSCLGSGLIHCSAGWFVLASAWLTGFEVFPFSCGLGMILKFTVVEISKTRSSCEINMLHYDLN